MTSQAVLHSSFKTTTIVQCVDKGRITTVNYFANRVIVGVVGFYVGVEELSHWWKYGNMNL